MVLGKKGDKPYYFNVQEALIDKGYWAVMKDIDRRLYIALCRYADWETRKCWPSNAELCKVTRMCVASVIKAGNQLKALNLIDTWYFREEGEKYYKKFYLIKPLDDLIPLEMDISTIPPRMDISSRKRGKNGRFLPNDSIGNGTPPSNANGIPPSNSNGHETNLNITNLNITNLREKSSFKNGEKEAVKELIKAIGKERTREELRRMKRDPNLVDEITI